METQHSWLGNVVVRELDLRLRGHEFDSWSVHCWVA